MQFRNTRARTLTSMQRLNEACYKILILVDYCSLKILISYITENPPRMILFKKIGFEYFRVSFADKYILTL